MRFWKALGGVLVFLGCLMALAGILATIAPMIDNEQVRRIIESFSTRTLDPVLNGINEAILYGLRNHYLIFALGAGLLLTGGLLRAAAGGSATDKPVSGKPSVRKPTERKDATTTRLATPARAAHPQETAPDGAAAPKREQSLSPFAAAVYGKALSGDPSTDIAAKYMPRSIIDTPAESTAAPAQVVQGAAADNNVGAQTAGDWKLGETVYCRTCGAANPWQSAFCDQCGSRLVWPDVEKPTENRITKDDAAFRSTVADPAPLQAAPLQTQSAVVLYAPVSPGRESVLKPVMAMESASAAADPGVGVPTVGQPQRVDRQTAMAGDGQPMVTQTQNLHPVATVMAEPASVRIGGGSAQTGTVYHIGHPRVVSTLRRIIAEPTPVVGEQQAAAPLPPRPRIVSTIGKKPR